MPCRPCARTGNTVRASRAQWTACLLVGVGIGAGVCAGAAAGAGAGAGAESSNAGARTPSYAPVTADQRLVFPADYGSHPQFRTEWWYVTGWLTTENGESLGFQITFFRTKPDIDEHNPSAFTPHQLLVA